ncbi:hypothetical protein ALC62_06325, partial [Cyphomyrmex costatus]
KRAVINVQSKDNACFAWSVVSALHPAQENGHREFSYPHYSSVLNLTNIEFPMTLSQIKKFENLNDISINVYAIEDGIVPIRLADHKRSKHVNLLYVEDNIAGHFALIKDLSRLVNSQINKYGHKKYFCNSSSCKLELHNTDCGKLNDCAIRLPSEDKWLKFKNHCRKERVPFVVYADLECALKKMDEDPTSSMYQHHQVFSIAYYIHCSYDDSLSSYRFRRDNNCISWFADELKNLAHSVQSVISTNVPMDFSPDDWRKFNSATHCHMCEKPFAKDDKRPRDHCNLTGRYRGPAHSNCNLNYKDSRCIPVVFHNLTGYDAHFIIKEIATAYKGNTDLLPITKEKYISFTKHDDTIDDKKNCIQLRFIDSYRFLASSLEKLASFLSKDKLRVLRREFSHLSEENFNLLTRKDVFPYEYIDCSEKLNESSLPSCESFYSSLTDATVSEDDYAYAVNVWQRFSIQTLGEYSDLYLKTDVLLLADVFENFRDSCVASYGLDPAYYYTLPGFTRDAMLNHTGVKFELLTDIDMVMFVERGISGDLSQCSNRYARANNKYMPSYDPSKQSSYLMYYDVNNLYGWAMCQPLRYADFRWVDDVQNFDFTTIALDSPTGYILEVDLEYPQHLHDTHTDLPFCPTREKPPGKRDDKLLATVLRMKKYLYVIHYRNLQQCTRHSLRIVKIHRILQFTQSPWLRDYIELNTKFRTLAKNDFEKNLYKLMNNAVFGKTMENVRDRVDLAFPQVVAMPKCKGCFAVIILHFRQLVARVLSYEMADILNIVGEPIFDDRIVKFEIHTYNPYANTTFGHSDEIRIPIQQQDLYTLPCESFLYIKGRLTVKKKDDETPTTLGNNCIAFMFDEIRYELNSVEMLERRILFSCGIHFCMEILNFEMSLLEIIGKKYKLGWSPVIMLTESEANLLLRMATKHTLY